MTIKPYVVIRKILFSFKFYYRKFMYIPDFSGTFCKKQPIVVLLSTEVEYQGVVVATCEAIWLKRLLKDLQVEVSDPTTICCDNLNNIQPAKNSVFHARTKHIEVHFHFVRECVLSGEVELVYVRMDRQTADIFTRPLGLDKGKKRP